MSAGFEFRTTWDVPCGRRQLWKHLDALVDSDDPMIWWPSVQVTESRPGRVSLRTRSAFGYHLNFRLTDLVLLEPDEMRFAADGDLAGRGVVTFVDDGPGRTSMLIDWQVSMVRPWMRRTSWLLRPVFTVAHRLVMREGERRFAGWLRDA